MKVRLALSCLWGIDEAFDLCSLCCVCWRVRWHWYICFLRLPAIAGVLGLVSMLLLMPGESILRRHQYTALLTTSGSIAGTCAAGWFLFGVGTMEVKQTL
jgi:hypothetical protein